MVVLFAALVGFTIYLNKQKQTQAAQATPTAGTTTLFSPADGTVSGIKIVAATGESVDVERDQNGVWALKAPEQAAADAGSVEAAATQIGALSVIGDVQLGLDVVGLDKPAYTITINFATGKSHTLAVGSITPIQTGYYVQLDGGKVQIVDNQGIDALLMMLKAPPYLATPTPVATDTPAITPTSDVTLTPAVTTTPATAASSASPTATATKKP